MLLFLLLNQKSRNLTASTKKKIILVPAYVLCWCCRHGRLNLPLDLGTTKKLFGTVGAVIFRPLSSITWGSGGLSARGCTQGGRLRWHDEPCRLRPNSTGLRKVIEERAGCCRAGWVSHSPRVLCSIKSTPLLHHALLLGLLLSRLSSFAAMKTVRTSMSPFA